MVELVNVFKKRTNNEGQTEVKIDPVNVSVDDFYRNVEPKPVEVCRRRLTEEFKIIAKRLSYERVRHAFFVTQGTGKTRALFNKPHGLLHNLPKNITKTLATFANHHKAQEFEADCKAHNIKAYYYKGRGQEGMCRNYEKAAIVGASGASVTAALCDAKQKKKKGSQAAFICPYRGVCLEDGFLSQREEIENADIVVTVHNYLNYKMLGDPTFDLIIADESLGMDDMISKTKNLLLRDFKKKARWGYVEVYGFDCSTDNIENPCKDVLVKTANLLGNFAGKPVWRKKVKEFLDTECPPELLWKVARYLDMKSDRHYTKAVKEIISDDRKDYAKAISRIPKRRYRDIANVLRAIAEQENVHEGSRIYNLRVRKTKRNAVIECERWKRANISGDESVIVLDGTGNQAIAQATYGSGFGVTRLETIRNQKSFLITASAVTHFALEDANDRRDEKLNYLMDHIKALEFDAVIMPKGLISRMVQEDNCPEVVHDMYAEKIWLNNIRGLNKLEHRNKMLVIGRILPSSNAVNTIAAALATKLGVGFKPAEDYVIANRNVGIYPYSDQVSPATEQIVEDYSHPSPVGDLILRQMCHAESEQALDRARGVNADPNSPLEVHYMTSRCIPNSIRWSNILTKRTMNHRLKRDEDAIIENDGGIPLFVTDEVLAQSTLELSRRALYNYIDRVKGNFNVDLEKIPVGVTEVTPSFDNPSQKYYIVCEQFEKQAGSGKRIVNHSILTSGPNPEAAKYKAQKIFENFNFFKK